MAERPTSRQFLREALEDRKDVAEDLATSHGHALSWQPIRHVFDGSDTFIPGECTRCGASVELFLKKIEGDAVSVSCPGKR